MSRRDGEAVRLSRTELAVLNVLVQRAGALVERHELLATVWGMRGVPFDRTVDITIRRLRQKLESDPLHPEHLLTVPGRGYRFASDPLALPLGAPGARPPTVGELTPIYGREEEISGILGILDAGQPTLALQGVAGSGKTTTAQAVARGWLDRGPVHVASLAGAEREAEVLVALADCLGHADSEALPALRVLRQLTAEPGALVVLDEAEGCTAALGALVSRWRQAGVMTQILVVSRIPARLDAPSFELGPLAIGPASRIYRPDDPSASFRVATAAGGHALSVELMGGLARLQASSGPERAAAAETYLSVRGAVSGPEAPLEAAVLLLWEALLPPERRLLTALAMLPSGLPAAAVPPLARRLECEPTAALERLTRAGLLSTHNPPALPHQERLGPHPAIRAVLMHRARTAGIYLEAYRACSHALSTLLAPLVDRAHAGDLRARRALRLEHQNLRVLLRSQVGAQARSAAYALVAATAYDAPTLVPLRDIEDGLRLAEAADSRDARMELWAVQLHLAQRAGDRPRAENLVATIERASRDDSSLVGWWLWARERELAHAMENSTRASLLTGALSLASAADVLGNPAVRVRVRLALAELRAEAGAVEEAASWLRQAQEAAGPDPELPTQAAVLRVRALLGHRIGDLAQAESDLREASIMFGTALDGRSELVVLAELSLVLEEVGEALLARQTLRRAELRALELGIPLPDSGLQLAMAWMALGDGDPLRIELLLAAHTSPSARQLATRTALRALAFAALGRLADAWTAQAVLLGLADLRYAELASTQLPALLAACASGGNATARPWHRTGRSREEAHRAESPEVRLLLRAFPEVLRLATSSLPDTVEEAPSDSSSTGLN